jgi:hypothetical protein
LPGAAPPLYDRAGTMALPTRSLPILLSVLLVPAVSLAGSVTGKLDLPPTPPERPAAATRGFLDRVDNPLKELRAVNPTPNLVVVLEGGDKPSPVQQRVWDLLGDSFDHPLIAVPAGIEVVIKNSSPNAHTLVAAEDPNLITKGALNPPPGSKSFHVGAAGAVYHISDPGAPYLKGKIIVVAPNSYVASPDEAGKFELADVPEGTYKVRVYYAGPEGHAGWIEHTDDVPVTVPAKGKVDINPKIPAGFPVKK